MDTKCNLNRVEWPNILRNLSLSTSIILCSFSLLSSNHHQPFSLKLSISLKKSRWASEKNRHWNWLREDISLWPWGGLFGDKLWLCSSSRVRWLGVIALFLIFFFVFLSFCIAKFYFCELFRGFDPISLTSPFFSLFLFFFFPITYKVFNLLRLFISWFLVCVGLDFTLLGQTERWFIAVLW